MAQKLNWKVAVIGLFILVFLAACGIFVFMHYNKNPRKLIAKAEQLLAEALSETEALGNNFTEDQQEEVKGIYTEALNNYGGAYGAAKDPDFKIEILFTIVDFHLMDNPVHPRDWRKAAGIWRQILTIDPKNVEANKALLDYSLETANSLEKAGAQAQTDLWKRIMEYSGELITVMEEKGQSPETYIRAAKAKGMLTIALAGQTTNQEKSLDEAVAELEKVQELDPSNVDIYVLLGKAATLEGEIDERNGSIGAIEDSVQTRSTILEQAIEAAPNNVEAYVNLLDWKLINASSDIEKIDQLEADYVGLADQFKNEPKAIVALADYYSLTTGNIDKAIEYYSRAMELDRKNAIIANKFASAYYKKGTAMGDVSALEQTAKIVDQALKYPNAVDVEGPNESANRLVRFGLLNLEGMAALEIALNSEEPQKGQWAEKLSQTVYQIEQFFGSEENPQVMKWRGFIDAAKGDDNAAIARLYNAYRQFRATAATNDNGQYISPDLRYLSYILSRLFVDRNEIGLRKQFLEDAIVNGITQTAPQALLDYSDILLFSQQFTDVIAITSNYNERYPRSERVNQLLVKAYAMAGEYDKAEQLLATMDGNAIETLNLKIDLLDRKIPRMVRSLMQLNSGAQDQAMDNTVTQAQIDVLQKERLDAINKALDIDPKSVAYPAATFLYQTNHGQIAQAKELVDHYLAYTKPADNEIGTGYIQGNVFSQTLAEPDPQKVPVERYQELMLNVISSIPDVKQRNISLASFYTGQAEFEKAQEHLIAALDADPDDATTLTLLFNGAIQLKDSQAMQKYAKIAEEKNSDGCNGYLFKAKIDMTEENFPEALRKLDQCLEYDPVNAEIYLLQSRCYSLQNNHNEAVDAAKTALQMNFLNGEIAKNYASIVFARNTQLGPAVTPEQFQELQNALAIAITRNPGNWELQGMYAQQIADKNPEQALAIRQSMVERFPNPRTYLQLGNLALTMSEKTIVSDKKAALLQIAEKAFQDSYNLDPTNESLLNSFSEYYRVTGQTEKAEQLFAGKDKLMWQFHLRNGQTEKALEILQEQYTADPKDPQTLSGLVTISQQMGNHDDLIRYSDELVEADNSVAQRLLQIQSLLNAGLIAESEEKIEQIKKIYPDDPRIMFAEAWLTFTKGKPQEALVLINKYINENPEDAAALNTRAQIHRTLGNLTQAVNDLQKSQLMAPSPQTQFTLAQIQRENGNTAIAIGTLKEIIKGGNSSPQVMNLLESIYIENKRFEDLQSFYADMLAQYPDNIYWNLRAGQLAKNLKKYSVAKTLLLKAWQTSLPQGGNPTAFGQYLSLLIEMGDLQGAQAEALKHTDDNFAAIAYANLGMIQVKLDDKQKALEYYHKSLENAGDNENLTASVLSNMLVTLDARAVSDWCNEKLEKDPGSLAANMTLFKMYQRSGDYDKALIYINNCLENTDKSDDQWTYFGLQKAEHLTLAYLKTNDKRFVMQAVESYENVLEKYPDNTDIMNNLAYLLADNDLRPQDAVDYSQKAYQARPNDTNRMDTYAYALSKAGQFQKAEELHLSAIAITQQRGQDIVPEVYKHLALAQRGLEKNNDAIESYKKYLELGADNISQEEKEQIQQIISNLMRN